MQRTRIEEGFGTFKALNREVSYEQDKCDQLAKCPMLAAKQGELMALAIVLLRLLPRDSKERLQVEGSLVANAEAYAFQNQLAQSVAFERAFNRLSDKQVASLLSQWFPAFNWPPPAASEALKLETSLLRRSAKQLLGDVDALLARALDKAGYTERRYFAVPNGFAVVTRLEQIDSEGVPLADASRWVSDVEPLPERFSLGDYLKALFRAPRSYFRVVAFIVTDQTFADIGSRPNKDDSHGWQKQGANRLPASVAAREYTRSHDCTALIYEFESFGSSTSPTVLVPGRLGAQKHLQKSGILSALVTP